MIINKDTAIYGSFSANPGNLGCARFNAAFERNGVNAIYLPLKIEDNFYDALKVAKIINIRGMAISMPHKTSALLKCDDLDKTAKIAGSVNTIIFENQRSIGYNTDYLAIQDYLDTIEIDKEAIIIGTGAFSRSAYLAFTQKNIQCQFIDRTEFNKNRLNIKKIDDKIIFNATPEDITDFINEKAFFIDCRTSTYTGKLISFFGAKRQFYEIYKFSKNFIFEEI